MMKNDKEKFKDYPSNNRFRIKDSIGVPHLYCITSELVCYAAENHNGILDEKSIKDAENSGLRCGMKECHLKYEEHEQVLLVEINDNRELKDVPGLQKYLQSCKALAERDKFAGFAFIQKKKSEMDRKALHITI